MKPLLQFLYGCFLMYLGHDLLELFLAYEGVYGFMCLAVGVILAGIGFHNMQKSFKE